MSDAAVVGHTRPSSSPCERRLAGRLSNRDQPPSIGVDEASRSTSGSWVRAHHRLRPHGTGPLSVRPKTRHLSLLFPTIHKRRPVSARGRAGHDSPCGFFELGGNWGRAKTPHDRLHEPDEFSYGTR